MRDIIDRIRDTETMPLSSVAARADVRNILQEAREEIARLRLTDAERAAVGTAEASLMWESTSIITPQPVRQKFGAAAATLRGLLERTK